MLWRTGAEVEDEVVQIPQVSQTALIGGQRLQFRVESWPGNWPPAASPLPKCWGPSRQPTSSSPPAS